jgi:hypothetical protein
MNPNDSEILLLLVHFRDLSALLLQFQFPGLP